MTAAARWAYRPHLLNNVIFFSSPSFAPAVLNRLHTPDEPKGASWGATGSSRLYETRAIVYQRQFCEQKVVNKSDS